MMVSTTKFALCHLTRVYVYLINIQALHDTFAAFGNVLSCKVATDEHGRSKGYGFVHFERSDAADNAIKSVDGMLLNDKKVFVGYHISRKVCAALFKLIVYSCDLIRSASLNSTK